MALTDSEPKWYILHTYSGYEAMVKDSLEKLIENRAENSVVVFYAVSDRAGNVAKCSREFAAVFVEDTENGNVQDRMSGYEGADAVRILGGFGRR